MKKLTADIEEKDTNIDGANGATEDKANEKIHKKPKLRKRTKIIIFIGLAVIIFFFCHYQNHHLTITKVEYTSTEIGSDLDGYKIVQISDLHNAVFGKDNSTLVSKIKKLAPDMIVITGDIVDTDKSDITATVSLVGKLNEICQVYYVTGNHEFWLTDENFDTLISGLENAGARVMFNEVIKISRGNSSFNLIGLDDRNLLDKTIYTLMDQVDDSELNILIAHEPQIINRYSDAGVDYVFTGHAHGGQFRFPFIKGVYAPGQGFFPKYTSGEYTVGNTTMMVNRGLGNSVIPVRLFDYPEIVCVTLKAASE